MLTADEKRIVLAVANRKLGEQGLEKVSLEEIAAEAGIPLGKIKPVYPEVKDIFRAAIKWGINDFKQFFSDMLARRGKPDLKTKHLVRGMLKRYDSHYLISRLVSLRLATPGNEDLTLREITTKDTAEVLSEHARIIARIISKGQSENLFTRNIDPLAAAYMLLGMLTFLIRCKEETGAKFALADYAGAISRIFLKGLYR